MREQPARLTPAFLMLAPTPKTLEARTEAGEFQTAATTRSGMRPGRAFETEPAA
jgi:hypothetical protein